jgi:hypothetical protein
MTHRTIAVDSRDFHSCMTGLQVALYANNTPNWRVGEHCKIHLVGHELPFLWITVTHVIEELPYCEEDYVVVSFKLGQGFE